MAYIRHCVRNVRADTSSPWSARVAVAFDVRKPSKIRTSQLVSLSQLILQAPSHSRDEWLRLAENVVPSNSPQGRLAFAWASAGRLPRAIPAVFHVVGGIRVVLQVRMYEHVQLCQDQQTEFALLRESAGVSRVNHILRVHGNTILHEQRAAEVYDEIGQRSLEQLFPGLTEDKRPSAQASSELGSKERETSLLRHTWALSSQPNPASRPWSKDAVWAGLLPEQILEACLSEVIETATSTYLSSLDSDEQATAKLYVQKAAQAGNEAGQQIIGTARTGRRKPDHRIP